MPTVTPVLNESDFSQFFILSKFGRVIGNRVSEEQYSEIGTCDSVIERAMMTSERNTEKVT